MGNIWAIAQRELRSYFVSPVAYVVGALFILISSVLFALILNQAQTASVQPLFANFAVIFLFIVPGLTMRLLAEEQRTGTLELMLPPRCATTS